MFVLPEEQETVRPLANDHGPSLAAWQSVSTSAFQPIADENAHARDGAS
jgi:hypothetical protein